MRLSNKFFVVGIGVFMSIPISHAFYRHSRAISPKESTGYKLLQMRFGPPMRDYEGIPNDVDYNRHILHILKLYSYPKDTVQPK